MLSRQSSAMQVRMEPIGPGARNGVPKGRRYVLLLSAHDKKEKTMREDMFKVIVERPRLVNSNGYSRDGRKYRSSEDTPAHLGMKCGYNRRKWLNENLAPLRRYLEKQVNRPWDKVYSEIRATIDPRSAVKRHILQHIDDFVAVDTHWVETPEGGKVVIRGERWPRKDIFLEGSGLKLYVHPRTGILLRNRHYASYNARQQKERQTERERQIGVRRDLDGGAQLHCVEEVWYHVTLGTLPPGRVQLRQANGSTTKKIVYDACWDAVRREWVSRKHGNMPTDGGRPSNLEMYASPDRYAVSKRQLNSHELKRFGLIV
jgi:hypothetical protein